MEFFFPVDPLDDVRRLYRQACLLRLANESSAAARILQQDLPDRVAELQASDADGRWTTEALQSAFAEEYRRVVDAQVVGDLVLSRLHPSAAHSPAASPVTAVATPAEPAHRKAPAPSPAGPQSITDMLDSMLTQDRPRKPRSQ